MDRNTIIRMTNELIEALLLCDDEELVDTVCNAVSAADPIEEEE